MSYAISYTVSIKHLDRVESVCREVLNHVIQIIPLHGGRRDPLLRIDMAIELFKWGRIVRVGFMAGAVRYYCSLRFERKVLEVILLRRIVCDVTQA